MGRRVRPWPRAGACRVEYRPDAGDLLACDLERVDRHGDAVLLGHQAGLAVDCALQERHAGYQAGDSEAGARDLLGALDPAGQGGGEVADVAGHGGAGVEQADQGADVPGFPGLFEGPDDAGLPGGGVAGGCAARTRRRAEVASWRHAAGVRPVISATSVKG